MGRITRLPEVRTLSEILPRGTEGGKEFARIVDLLLFYSAAREGRTARIFSDRSGDYFGLDSFQDHPTKKTAITGYQYKFFSSPLSAAHRAEIVKALLVAEGGKFDSRIENWILVTPDDLSESSVKSGGGDVSWFEGLKDAHGISFEIEHWGHRKLQALFLAAPSLCLFYYPELIAEGSLKKKTIESVRGTYDKNLAGFYNRIEFVGMSVYKPEATRGVEMEDIYIPISVARHGVLTQDNELARINPLTLLTAGVSQVVLGDPGSGKSTLLKFLALVGQSKQLQTRYEAKPDGRLPIVIILRKYADALRVNKNISLLEHISQLIIADFSLRSADQDFFEYYLESGQAILLFDGLDELPNADFKRVVRDRIDAFVTAYPLNTTIITSRIVGYDQAFGFDPERFPHYTVAPLTLPEMDQFVSDWYKVRIENEAERKIYISDLMRIFRNPEQQAIKNLAENPLLLTIVALVHRIDAVLPDERVVLYQKCTETLLNTWHTWKYRTADSAVGRGRIERTNRRRIESLAIYMQIAAGAVAKSARAVLAETEVLHVLQEHILAQEGISSREEALDLAGDFLRFVKERAGLLVEVGESQYSFVHLTFQEYLTATALAVDMEFGGIERLWIKWQEKTADARWHEVFRLFVAGMKSDSSQIYVIGELLELNRKASSPERLYLLGGFLIDGIKCKDEHAYAIVETLLWSFLSQESPDISARLVSILRALSTRYAPVWHEVLQQAWLDNVQERPKLLLAAFSAGMAVADVNSIFSPKNIECSADNIESIALFLGESPLVAPLTSTTFERAHAFERLLTFNILQSPGGNASAVAIERALALMPDHECELNIFSRGLVAILAGKGPFTDYFFNKMPMHGDGVESSFQISQRRAISHASVKRGDVDGKRQTRKPEVVRTLLTEIFKRSGVRWSGGDIMGALQNIAQSELDHTLAKPSFVGVPDMERVSEEVGAQDAGIQFLIDTFDLHPSILWGHALAATLVPKLHRKKNEFTESALLELVKKVESKTCAESDFWALANFLLYDIWLYSFGGHISISKSPLAVIDKQLQSIQHPAVLIANSLRLALYGDAEAALTISRYIEEPDGPIATIIKRAYYKKSLHQLG